MKDTKTFIENKRWLKSILFAAAFLLCINAVIGNFQVKADGEETKGINVMTPSQSEISKRLNELQNLKTQYKEEALLTAPYSAGTLTDETLQNAMDWMNLVRFVAGIPDNVTLNDGYNQLAQASSIVNFANDDLSHYPTKPEGIDSDLYDLGYTGSSKSNIACGWGSSFKNGGSFRDMILHSWMADSDNSNISRVGHRRWILNPSMTQTGFGCVWGADGNYGGRYFSAHYAMDNPFGSTEYYGVAWPAQNMPTSFFQGTYPWSYSLGTAVSDDAKVTLTRVSDGKTWEFSYGSKDFYIENQNYGRPGCIIFRPSDITSYNDGDVYKVVITGTGLDVKYTVNFFDAETGSENPTQTPTQNPTQTPSPEPTKEPTPKPTATPTATPAPTKKVSVTDKNFTFTDIRTGNTVSFDGADGIPKILVFGGISSCGNTNAALNSINHFYPEIAEDVQIISLDVKDNKTDTMVSFINDCNMDPNMSFGSTSTFKGNVYSYYEFINLGKEASGSDVWGTMPMILYIDKNGDIVQVQKAYHPQAEIEAAIFSFLSRKTATPEPTKEPTNTPTPEPTEEPTETPTPELTPEPTEEPTETPTPELTPEPTEEPTSTPTPEPTQKPEPKITPVPTQAPAKKGALYEADFSFKDASTSKKVSFSGKDGKLKIVVISDMLNCWYTMDILSSISSQIKDTGIELFSIDTKGTKASTLDRYMENYDLDGKFWCAPEKNISSSGDFGWNEVKQAITKAAGVKTSSRRKKSSYSTPLIAYIDGMGNIIKTTTGNVKDSSIYDTIVELVNTKPVTKGNTPVLPEKPQENKNIISTKTAKYTVSGKKATLTLFASTASGFNIPGSFKQNGKKYYVKAIGGYVYGSNTSITEITIGKYVATINKDAFNGMKNLSVININAAKLTKVGKNAFKGIAKNAVFNITGTNKQFKKVKELILNSGVANTVTFKRIAK